MPIIIGQSKKIVSDGLVGWWTMNGQDIQGTNLFDKSISNNNATSYGNPIQTIGKIGQALKFDGIDDYIVTNGSLPSSSQITYSCWVKVKPFIANCSILVSTIFKGFSFYSNNPHYPSFFVNSSYYAGAISSIAVDDDKWHLIVGTADGSDIRIYVDGIQTGQNTTTINTTAGPLYIGGDPTGLSWGVASYFPGIINDVRVYNKALSSNEILQLYNNGKTEIEKSQNIISDGLVGWWTMNGNDIQGQTLIDKTGNQNNGTIINNPTQSAGIAGQCFDFNGINQYIALGINPNLAMNTTNAFTISAWTKPKENAMTVFAKGSVFNSADSFSYFLAMNANDINARVSDGTTQISCVAYGAVSLNIWQHIIVTWDGISKTLRIFKNSVLLNDATDVGFNGIWEPSISQYKYASIAADSAGDARYYNAGKIDDVRLYNRVLSNEEIIQLYNNEKLQLEMTKNSVPEGLKGWWTLNGNDIQGTTVLDRSGNGKHGTIFGPIKQVAGKFGQALNLATSRVATGLTDNFMNVSISLWFKLNDTLDTDRRLIDQGASSPIIRIENTTKKIQIIGNIFLEGITTIYPKQWYHVVGIFGSTGYQIFIDGRLENSNPTAFPGPGNGNEYSIGGGFSDSNCIINNVKIYNRILTSEEIQKLYNE